MWALLGNKDYWNNDAGKELNMEYPERPAWSEVDPSIPPVQTPAQVQQDKAMIRILRAIAPGL